MPRSFKPKSAAARPTRAKLLQALLDHTLDALLVADDEGRLVDANPAACALLEYARAEILRRTISELIPDLVPELARHHWHALMAQGERRGTAQLTTQTGRALEVAYRATADIVRGHHLIVLRDRTAEQRDARLHAALFRISEAAHAARDLDELYREAHVIVGTLMPARNFYIALYDARTNLLSFPYYADEYDAAWATHPLGDGLTSYVIRTGAPLLATPEGYAELVRAGKIQIVGTPAVDWLGTPLQTRAGTIGVLAVQTYTPHVRLTDEHKASLTT